MGSKTPTLSKGKVEFYCVNKACRKPYELDVLKREHTKRGGDLLRAKCPQGHSVTRFAKRQE